MSNEPLTPSQKKRLALNWLIFLSIVAVVVCYFVQRDRSIENNAVFTKAAVLSKRKRIDRYGKPVYFFTVRYKVQDEFVRSSVQVASYQFYQNPIDSISIKYDSTHISNAKATK